MLTEYLTLFRFAMLVYEYKPDSEKVRKMRNLGNVVSAGSPLGYEQNQCAGEWIEPLTLEIF